MDHLVMPEEVVNGFSGLQLELHRTNTQMLFAQCIPAITKSTAPPC